MRTGERDVRMSPGASLITFRATEILQAVRSVIIDQTRNLTHRGILDGKALSRDVDEQDTHAITAAMSPRVCERVVVI